MPSGLIFGLRVVTLITVAPSEGDFASSMRFSVAKVSFMSTYLGNFAPGASYVNIVWENRFLSTLAAAGKTALRLTVLEEFHAEDQGSLEKLLYTDL